MDACDNGYVWGTNVIITPLGICAVRDSIATSELFYLRTARYVVQYVPEWTIIPRARLCV